MRRYPVMSCLLALGAAFYMCRLPEYAHCCFTLMAVWMLMLIEDRLGDIENKDGKE